MAKISAARPPRSKAEVQQDFPKVHAEATASREAANPKADEAIRARETGIRQAVDGLSVERVVEGLAALGIEVSKSIADISEKLVTEVQRLAAVREAVALEQAELSRLHKLDIAATALDQLVQAYDARKHALETEIATRRAEWDSEAKAREREAKELEESLKKQRQREIEEYEYKKTTERKRAQEKYDEEMRALEKRNREKQETLEKGWQAREQALKEREEELARLQKEVAGFPARLQAEIERAGADAVRETERRFEQAMVVAGKEREADQRFATLQITALEENVARQAAQIAALEKQLEDAKRQVQDIAVKAIEGASGARALSHVNQIAMEQAKTRAGSV